MFRPLFLAAACFASAACVGAAVPAFADTVVVSARDLDTASPSGRAALDRRIAAAARRVCTDNDMRTLRNVAEARRCVADAIRAAESQLGDRPAQLALAQ